jgi:hypothetical protein
MKTGPDPSFVVTAEETTKGFAEDGGTFNSKYDFRRVILEGTVASIDDQEFLLEGAGQKYGKPVRVSILPLASELKAFKNGKKGTR